MSLFGDERRERAAKKIAQLKKSGHNVKPVVIEGRKIATTFWGKSWCDNLEVYSDFASRLPKGSHLCSQWISDRSPNCDWEAHRPGEWVRNLQRQGEYPPSSQGEVETGGAGAIVEFQRKRASCGIFSFNSDFTQPSGSRAPAAWNRSVNRRRLSTGFSFAIRVAFAELRSATRLAAMIQACPATRREQRRLPDSAQQLAQVAMPGFPKQSGGSVPRRRPGPLLELGENRNGKYP